MLAHGFIFIAARACRRTARASTNAVGLRRFPLGCRSHSVSGRGLMENHPEAVAEQLSDWFRSILHFTGESLFSIVPEGPHRDAGALDHLQWEAELDSKGKLYSPLCFFMAAACRKLGTSLGVGHWRAALDNVVHLQHRIVSARAESEMVGLEFGSPAVLFKQEQI